MITLIFLQVIADNTTGLLFKNKRDRKVINVDPKVNYQPMQKHLKMYIVTILCCSNCFHAKRLDTCTSLHFDHEHAHVACPTYVAGHI